MSEDKPNISEEKPKRIMGIHTVIIVAGMVSLFTDLSSEMIVPILPLFLTTVLHVPVDAIGLIEGIAESTASILKLFSGWISDRMGKRKPLMIAGYGFSNLIKPLFALTTTWSQVLLIRFADRFGKGVRGAPRDALIADAATKEERGKSFGFHRAMDTIGAAIGPFTAFAVLAWFHGNYRMVFWISAIPGMLAVILLVFFLKEKQQPVQNKPDKPVSRLPKFGFQGLGKRFFWFSIVSAVFSLGNSSDAFLILRAQNIGMEPTLIPLAYFAFNLAYSIFALPFGILSDKIGRRTVIVFGYVIFAVIYLGFGLAKSTSLIWVLFIIYGLYYAATEGIQKAYVADLVPQGQRGTAIGTFNAMTGLAALPASILAGLLWQQAGPFVTFAASSVLAILSAVLMVLFRI